jgi:hypothetical protein
MRNASVPKCLEVASIAFGFAVAVSAPVLAADVKSEIMTAAQHAQLAAGAQTLDMVHAHLHHTINCLVGPKGTDFDAKELNPCQNNGDGAIPDSADAAAKTKLMSAVDKAKAGLHESDLAAAQKDATQTAAIIDAAK